MGDFNLDILPNEIQDNIYSFVGYKEEFNEVLRELKMVFKINKLLNHNNQITTYYINHYIYYNDD
jgi:hypothetical protein